MLSFSTSDKRLFLSLFACLCLLPHARAQDQRPAPNEAEEDVVRIRAELVQTDVMVFDRSGKFVDGLKPEQFELLVDGKPQEISFFERVKAGTVDEDAQLAAARGGGRTPAGKSGAALPLDRGRTIFFFVDDLHLSAGSAARIRKTLSEFIEEELGQNDEAAVTSASGQIGFLSQMTDEKAVLRAAVNRLNARALSARDYQTPPMSESQALAIDRNDTLVKNYFVDALLRDTPLMQRQTAESMVDSRARGILQQSGNVTLTTLVSLENVMRAAAPLAGRKILFFVSDGFLLDLRDGALSDRLRRVTDAAARSSVVIYSLDAQGLTSGMPDASSDVAFDPTGRLATVNAGERSNMQDPLHTLAAETGGRALVNTNALDIAVTKALEETSVYYLLAWRPEETDGGARAKFRRIEVGVKSRPDLKVVVRRGFYNFTPPEPPARAAKKPKKEELTAAASKPSISAADRELLKALSSQHPLTPLPTSLALGYVNNPEAGMVLTASIELPREGLNLLARPPGASADARAKIDVAGAIVNDHGKVVENFKQEISFPFRMLEDASRRVMYSYQARLPPGLYQVRVAARDSVSGRTGSALRWVEIPDIKRGGLVLSSLFLGERPPAKAPDASKTADPVASNVMMSVERRFSRSSWLRFLVYIYNAQNGAAGKPDVALQVQIFRDNQPVLTAPLSKLNSEGFTDTLRLPYMAELSLASFPAGSYVLQLTAIDRPAKASASQRVSFVIE
jgi:VWFA-related protein